MSNLEKVESLVQEAGTIAMHHFHNLQQTDLHIKDDGSPVTAADKEIDMFLTENLLTNFPEYGVLSEEGDAPKTFRNQPLWIIDPIDATKNFIAANPHFAISIALWNQKTLALGVVYAPSENKLFTWAQNREACLNGKPICVSKRTSLRGARILLDHGFHAETIRIHSQLLRILTAEGALVESLNCASLDICLVASGAYDARIHCRNQAWDIAAGMAIAQESGAALTNLDGTPKNLFGPGIVVSTPGIHESLLRVIKRAATETQSL